MAKTFVASVISSNRKGFKFIFYDVGKIINLLPLGCGKNLWLESIIIC